MTRVAYGMLQERGISCITAVATQEDAQEEDLRVQVLKLFHSKELRLGLASSPSAGTRTEDTGAWSMAEC